MHVTCFQAKLVQRDSFIFDTKNLAHISVEPLPLTFYCRNTQLPQSSFSYKEPPMDRH